MRTEQEILTAAANLKRKIISRSKTITDVSLLISEAENGIGNIPSQSMIESMLNQKETLVQMQWRDRHFYAMLRWALSVTDEYDPDNLELDK